MEKIDDLIEEKAKGIVQQVKSETEKKKMELDEKKAKTLVGVVATEQAIMDEDLKKGVTDRKKAEILNYADANLKKEEAENKKADILLQEANYGVYNGVATYAGIKKPLPHKMQSILFTILSAIQTIMLIAFGIPISVINIIADGVDSVVKKLATLTKSARWVVLVAILLGFLWLVAVLIKYFLLRAGIV